MIERMAQPDDAEALSTLGKETFVETFGHLYTAENLAIFLENHAPARWAEQLADSRLCDPRRRGREGRLIAYAKLGPPSLPFTPQGHPIELRQLYVLKPWHGCGLAARLMDWTIAEARARGADELYLSVFTDNHRARRFYERYGFRFVQTYAFMVGDHADEDHIMRLEL